MASSPRSPREPRFSRRPEARPEELLDAAVATFGERGFRATTLDEVAQRAGVSKGTVYLYFSSKDDLFRAMVEKKVVALIEGGETMAREHTGSAAELLTKMVHRMWEILSRDSMVCLSRLVQAELAHFPEVKRFYYDNVIQRQRRLIRQIAERGVASGEFRADAPRVLPFMVPALVVHLNQQRALFSGLEHDFPPSEAMRDHVVALLLDGIRTPPKAPRAVASGPRRRKSR